MPWGLTPVLVRGSDPISVATVASVEYALRDTALAVAALVPLAGIAFFVMLFTLVG